MITGSIHSFESFGTVDGPGIRTVIFFAGCHLRCQYCHNIDMTTAKSGNRYTSDQILEKVLKNKDYFEASGGGVTLSGGDPLFQPAFVLELLKKLKKAGIHTTVDTSLHIDQKLLKPILPYVDLFMVSLKHFDQKIHKQLTGVDNQQILNNLKLLSDENKRLWLRYVILPGYTDTAPNLTALKTLLKKIKHEKLELRPYHKKGLWKWNALGQKNLLANLPEVEPEQVELVKAFIYS